MNLNIARHNDAATIQCAAPLPFPFVLFDGSSRLSVNGKRMAYTLGDLLTQEPAPTAFKIISLLACWVQFTCRTTRSALGRK